METELQIIDETTAEIPSLSLLQDNYVCIDSIARDPDFDDPRYTSLKDLIPHSSSSKRTRSSDGNGFYTGHISIRNQLVKRAASAYLQSAAILMNRNENWMVALWRKMKSKVIWRSYWHVYVCDPLRACFEPIRRVLAQMVHQVGEVNSGRARAAIPRN